MKYISIGFLAVSYSAIDCLQEPHGGIGAIVLLESGCGNSHFKIFASG
jgi:hypothetical protein